MRCYVMRRPCTLRRPLPYGGKLSRSVFLTRFLSRFYALHSQLLISYWRLLFPTFEAVFARRMFLQFGSSRW